MPNPTAAMLVIGDEILSGRTRDANAYHLAGQLTAVGIDLREVRVVPDDHDVIVGALHALRDGYTHVFTSGGIGPTHDDIAADAVAAAFGVGIAVRDDARALLEEAAARRGTVPSPEQLRMARIPDGATLIANDVSGAPGFSLGNVHVMAGVPSIFRAMLDALLPGLQAGVPRESREVRFEVGESRVAGPLRELAERTPALSFGSYPFSDGQVRGTTVVVRGTDATLLDDAIARLEEIRRAVS
ncbi:competence/damage-inducible protein A [Georgenia wutianyii]|uniref:Competence/damage-inducible protein A n=1 Tax=Georgenia wutianyii TaxID=2585135 RepID=A0ABX5VLB1_9MICO|nr:molybdopterin-binding protein [Georgenia wutianyii]QDB79261.1 competence/damage-inducible protein A [Georgenia wutianyii]